jgi:PPM family protein phosphatase
MNIRAHAAATHAGRKRRRNEDAYVDRPPLFAVADGMGGAQAGEVASRLAAAALEDDGGGTAAAEERVVALIEEANRRVFQRANEDEAASGMGTTMTVALVDEDRVTIGHVGDSRAYRFRDGQIEQLTDDHSLVAELVRSGRLTPEEADAHPQRSVITRAVGTDPDIDVDRLTFETQPGDVYLICSDGLSDMLAERQIRDVFAQHPNDLQGTATALVSAANRVGGDDNITVVVFEIGDDEPSSAETQAMDVPTKENALPDDDTLSGLEAQAVPTEPSGRDWSRLATAVVVIALAAIALLVWLVVR